MSAKKDFQKAFAKIERGALAAVEETAEAIRNDARDTVPRGETDRLHDSIGVKRDGLKAEVGVMDRQAYYGLYIEFGTSSRPARPFLGPAAEGQRRKFVKRMGKHIRKGK